MKKLFVVCVMSSFFSSLYSVENGDAAKKVAPKLHAQLESATTSVASGSLVGAVFFLLWKKGFMTAQYALPSGALSVLATIPTVFFLDTKYGFFPPKTASSFFKLGHQIILGDLARDELYNKILDIAEGSAINIINDIIEKYGFETSEDQLSNLKATLHKARSYLVDVIDEMSEKDLTDTEKESLPAMRASVEKAIKKVETTERLVAFKKEFIKAKEAIQAGKIQLDDVFSNGAVDIQADQPLEEHIKEIEEAKKRLLERKKRLPFACVSKKEFDKFIKRSDKLLKRLKRRK